ncbi:MAG: ABC transporter [Dethiosulfovibrio peptidovorans]|nr:MAG: ABC transporter [Dethiosulfovibrio peptidovorans]
MTALQFDQVSFGYDAPLFRSVSFAVPQGELLVVVGPNGGGKSTLLRLALGLLRPDSGAVSILGAPPGRRSDVGYVPQDVGQGLSMPVTVERVVSMGRLGTDGGSRCPVDEAMEAMDLSDLRNRSMRVLSQGQRQRVLIARALASDPALLLLDEPLASVDPASRQAVFDCLKKAGENRTVIIVSHDYSIIPAWATAVACVDRDVYYHRGGELTEDLFTRLSCSCPVELIGHGLPHRVLGEHSHD